MEKVITGCLGRDRDSLDHCAHQWVEFSNSFGGSFVRLSHPVRSRASCRIGWPTRHGALLEESPGATCAGMLTRSL
jgi:hypothetical protein